MAKKKSSAKKTVKAVAKKSPVKKSPAKKTSTKKPAVKKSTKPAKKGGAKKAAPQKTAAKKSAAKKSAVKKTAPVKKAAPKAAAPKASVKIAAPAKAAKPLNLSNFVTPLDDRLLVQLSEKAKRTAGGLYIPDTVSDVSGNLQGVIVSVGRGRMDKKGHIHPLDVKLGDRIVFAEYSGSKIKIQNEDLLILRESEVLGVVSN